MTAPRVGTAGWSLPASVRDGFPEDGSGLSRYASRFRCVEINTSFYRPHRLATYQRWADSVPAAFRFSVKMPKSITHEHRLKGVEEPLDRFLGEANGLGDRLGPILVQLPPSFAYDGESVEGFFAALRTKFAGAVACEPRHPTWFTSEADAALLAHKVARVAADPALSPMAARPGGWPGLAYWRLHGSPRPYYSGYESSRLEDYAVALTAHAAADVWCIFDNTAAGLAAPDALGLIDRVKPA